MVPTRLNGEKLARILTEGFSGSVVIDMDDCAFNTAQRSLLIFLEWLEAHCPFTPNKKMDLARKARMLLSSGQWPYLATNAFSTIVDNPGVVSEWGKTFEDFWKKRFFGNAYLLADSLNPGFKEFMDAIPPWARFMTGRHAASEDPEAVFPEGMQWATERLLFSHGWASVPVDFKPRWNMPDTAFKRGALEQMVRAGCRPAAFIDNEPGNVNVFLEVCKEFNARNAVGVLYDGPGVVRKPNPEELNTNAFVLTHWYRP